MADLHSGPFRLYAGRRRRDAIWTVLAYAATGLGLAMLAIILATPGVERLWRIVARRLHQEHRPAGGRRRSPQLDCRQRDRDRDRPRPWRAGRHTGGHLSRRIWREVAPRHGGAVHQRHSSERAFVVVGLLSYLSLVAPVGHFSAWAGGACAGMLAMPIMARTTEDILHLVPDALARPPPSLGMRAVARSSGWSSTARDVRRPPHRRSARSRAG